MGNRVHVPTIMQQQNRNHIQNGKHSLVENSAKLPHTILNTLPPTSAFAGTPVPTVHIAGMYKLLERIGGGSFGDIFVGIHKDSGDKVAVKLVGLDFVFTHLLARKLILVLLAELVGNPTTTTKKRNHLIRFILNCLMRQKFISIFPE